MVTMPSSLRDADVRTRSDSIFAQAALYKVKDRHDGRDSGPTGQACSFGLLAGRPAPTPGWPLGSSLAVAFPLPAACSKVSSRQQTGPLILRTRQRKSGDHGDKSWKSDRRRDIKQAGGGVLGSDRDDDQGPPGGPPPPPVKMRLANLAWAQSHTHPPSSTHPRLRRRAHAFLSSSPFITTSDRKASSLRPLPSPLPPFTFCEFPKLQSTPFTPPRHSFTSTVGLFTTTSPQSSPSQSRTGPVSFWHFHSFKTPSQRSF